MTARLASAASSLNGFGAVLSRERWWGELNSGRSASASSTCDVPAYDEVACQGLVESVASTSDRPERFEVGYTAEPAPTRASGQGATDEACRCPCHAALAPPTGRARGMDLYGIFF